jgi:hypothetical protein
MGLTLQIPIATARTILNDLASDRYSDADLLQYGNDALDMMLPLVPHLFYAEGEIECIPTQAMQAVSYDDAASLVMIKRIKGGGVVLRGSKDALDRYDPNWMAGATGAAVNWFPVENDPMRFWIYPPAPATQQILECIYVRIPPEYAVDADTGIPLHYSDPIADYIVYRAETRDDEHVNSNRAAQFLQSFGAKVKGA